LFCLDRSLKHSAIRERFGEIVLRPLDKWQIWVKSAIVLEAKTRLLGPDNRS